MIAGHVISAKEAPRPESIDSVLAKNLVAARVIAGLTQHDLASAAGISRATIAQLETGYSDPRIATIVDIASALGIAPIVLLMAQAEVEALSELARGPITPRVVVPSIDLQRMLEYSGTGMLKDRVRAARLGAAVARASQAAASVALTAGLFSAALPGPGTVAGAELGRLLKL